MKNKYFYSLLLLLVMSFMGVAAVAQETVANEKPVMTIGCLSDLHNELGLISSSNLDQVRLRGTILNTVNKMREDEDIDLIVLGGDYTSDVTIPEANWERVRTLMADALRSAFKPNREKRPVIYVTGNHDYEVANFDNLPKPYNAARYYDFIMKDDIGELTEKDAFYEVADNGDLGTMDLLAAFHYEINGFDFVALNCGKFFFQSAWDYSYSLESVEWVGQKLAELYADDPERTVFFLLHIPFMDSNSISNANKGMGGRGSSEGVKSAERLKEILAQYPNVIMLYGHDHGSDNAYIRSKTSQRVTRYNTFGNVISAFDDTHVDEMLEGQSGDEDKPYTPENGVVKGYFRSYSGDGYLNYVSTDANLQCGTAKTEVTIAASATMPDRYTVLLNGGYIHLGSTAHFTGNTAVTMYSSPYLYKVDDPAATPVKAHRVKKLSDFNKGGYYALVGYAKKDGQWYLMGSENVTITYPGLAGLLFSAEEPGEEIEFESGVHAPIWEFECTVPKVDDNPDPEEPTSVAGYFESFSGDGFMNYLSTDANLQCGEAKSQVVVSHASAYAGRFTLQVNNNAYTHLGSTAHFTGNTAISEYSTPYLYHVNGIQEGLAKAKRVTSLLELKAGERFAIVGHAKKDGNWYLMGSENVTITYPGLAGIPLSTSEPNEEIEFEVGAHAPIWIFVADATGQGDTDPQPTTSEYTLQNKADGTYLTYTSNAGVSSVPAPIKVISTATTGVYHVMLPNGQYLYCGTNGRFSGNEQAANIWLYDAASGELESNVELGHEYILVGQMKSGGFYAVNAEMINSGLAGQRLLSTEVTMDTSGKLFLPEGDQYVWKLDTMPAGEPSFLSAFMGSMRYYSNSIEGDVSVSNSKIVQALIVYIYKDRIELKMKNYGNSGNFGGIKIEPELAGYHIFRTVHNAQGSLDTSIRPETVIPSMGMKKVYDLQGRRVNRPEKGVYIIHGKKVMR